MKTLVTGGVRSGKSRHSEALLAGFSTVTYLAPGPTEAQDPDPDWAARLNAHRATRPTTWTTVESSDLVAALKLPGPVLVDCLGTWLSAQLDAEQLWDSSSDEVAGFIGAQLDQAVQALSQRADPVVLVTNEVGLGVVPSHRSGRLFRDLLGTVNQRIAAACDEVHLVIAGRVLKL